MEILDSGDRREFGTGAVRDMACKGRCDLLPWSILPGLGIYGGTEETFCVSMEEAVHTKSPESIRRTLTSFVSIAYGGNLVSALLDSAYLYEAGSKKYAERNWEKGIPVSSFLDSAGRHFLKYRRGDKDESHDKAIVWNLLNALWTIANHPELAKA
jgi:hypothetical protein